MPHVLPDSSEEVEIMHDTSPDNPQLEALEERAEWELGCGRRAEAIKWYVRLLCSSWDLNNKYFEGQAIWTMHLLDDTFTVRKLKKLRREGCKQWESLSQVNSH